MGAVCDDLLGAPRRCEVALVGHVLLGDQRHRFVLGVADMAGHRGGRRERFSSDMEELANLEVAFARAVGG